MSNGLKIPFNAAINRFIKQSGFDLEQLMGQALPCHVVDRDGAIVTVAFDVQPPEGIVIPQVQCPILESQYVKLPIKVGDRGITIPAVANTAPTAGLGGEAAPFLTKPFNLSALIFVPVANSGWSNPDGTATIVTSQDGSSMITVSDGGIDIYASSIRLHGDAFIYGGLFVNDITNLAGGATISGRSFLSHTHTGVRSGTDSSGGVN